MDMTTLESKLNNSEKTENEMIVSEGFEFIDVTYDQGWTKQVHKKNITALAVNNSYDVVATGSEDNYIRIFSLLH
jgi:hypothetical protein